MLQAIACLTCTVVLWVHLDDFGTSEFSGGRLIEPLFKMADPACSSLPCSSPPLQTETVMDSVLVRGAEHPLQFCKRATNEQGKQETHHSITGSLLLSTVALCILLCNIASAFVQSRPGTSSSAPSGDLLTREKIVGAMLEHPHATVPLDNCPKDKTREWWASDMVAFFSKVYTEGRSEWPIRAHKD